MERIVKNNRTRQCTLYVASTKYGGGVASSQKRVFVKNRIWVVGPTTTTTTTTMYVVSLSRKQAAANYYIFIKYWNLSLSLSLSLSMSRYKLKLKWLFNKRPRLKHAWLSKRERERERERECSLRKRSWNCSFLSSFSSSAVKKAKEVKASKLRF